MSDCNENTNEVTLPHDTTGEVNIHQNETPDSSTLNRSSNRLLANDAKLLEYLKNVGLTSLSEGLTGCIKLESPGCVSLDMDYISKNICLSIADLDGIIKLSELCDVCISDPQDGHAVVWDDNAGCWSSGIPGIGSSEGDNVRTKCKFVPISDHVSLDTYQTPAAPTTSPIEDTFSYDVTEFNSNWEILPEDIEGFYISCRNFGRVDVTTLNGVNWKIEAKFPDGEYYTINSHEAWNTDDDGGNASTAFVPFDYDSDVNTLDIKLVLYDAPAEHFTGADGLGMNYFQIVGAKDCTVAEIIYPDMQFVHIKGVVNESYNSPDGYIDSGTAGDPLYSTWVSLTADQLLNDFSLAMPIIAPGETILTEVEFVGLTTTESVGIDDPGTDINSANGTGRAYITYDWVNRTIKGHCEFGLGGNILNQGAGIFNGILNQDVSINSTLFSGLDVNATTRAELRKITKVPIFTDVNGDVITRNVAYTIRHYKYKGYNSLETIGEVKEINDTNSVIEAGNCGTSYIFRPTADAATVLPPVTPGCVLKIIKGNTYNLRVQASPGEQVADSNISGYVENITTSEGGWANITLFGLDNKTWIIDGGHGTWVTG